MTRTAADTDAVGTEDRAAGRSAPNPLPEPPMSDDCTCEATCCCEPKADTILSPRGEGTEAVARSEMLRCVIHPRDGDVAYGADPRAVFRPDGSYRLHDYTIVPNENPTAHLNAGAEAPSVVGAAGVCSIPPEGWYCTRQPGHEGPCAAWPREAIMREPVGLREGLGAIMDLSNPNKRVEGPRLNLDKVWDIAHDLLAALSPQAGKDDGALRASPFVPTEGHEAGVLASKATVRPGDEVWVRAKASDVCTSCIFVRVQNIHDSSMGGYVNWPDVRLAAPSTTPGDA